MQTFWAVTKELTHFVVIEWFGWRVVTTNHQTFLPAPKPLATAHSTPVGRFKEPEPEAVQGSGDAVVAVATTAFRVKPVIAFDNVLTKLVFGTPLTTHNRQGRWCEVTHGVMRGWVLVDDIAYGEQHLQPELVNGDFYPGDHTITYMIRLLIADEFAAAELSLPLQDTEYVWCRLADRSTNITRPAERPRLAGRWHELLKGQLGIRIGIHPLTGSVMEYLTEDDVGHVAYVEAVAPNGTIEISRIADNETGRFVRETLAPEVYRELRPIFIAVG